VNEGPLGRQVGPGQPDAALTFLRAVLNPAAGPDGPALLPNPFGVVDEGLDDAEFAARLAEAADLGDLGRRRDEKWAETSAWWDAQFSGIEESFRTTPPATPRRGRRRRS
jgi:hypothetical protein